jgi:hypothetical protein
MKGHYDVMSGRYVTLHKVCVYCISEGEPVYLVTIACCETVCVCDTELLLKQCVLSK